MDLISLFQKRLIVLMIIVELHQYILKGRGETYILLFQGYITSVSSQFLIVENENFKRSGNKGNEKSYMEELRPYLSRE